MTMARYVPAIASVLGRTFGPLEVTADGEVVSRAAEYVLVANTSAYGGPFTMVPQADSTDGWLDLLTYEGPVLRRFPSLLIHGMRGTLGKVPGMRLSRVRSVAVAAPHAVPVQCDGEFLGHTPVEATVQPAALRLLVPASERHSQ
jgi:diacylglycerol kinase family enzyme